MRAMMSADAAGGEGHIGAATARGGNMLGGGDWSRDRLIPDLVAGARSGHPVAIRNPDAVRPWQHVLDPLRGYFVLAQRLHQNAALFEGAWNFGPPASHSVPVRDIADAVCELLDAGLTWRPDQGAHPPEARALRLDSNKAAARLDWRSRIALPDALDWTARWYKAFDAGADARVLMEADIDRYEALAAG
jgi:CDP-glucose 4,6-dehydratase